MNFADSLTDIFKAVSNKNVFFLCDELVENIHKKQLSPLLELGPKVSILADERTKSLENIPIIVNEMIDKGIKRGNQLVVIGGGITQDLDALLRPLYFVDYLGHLYQQLSLLKLTMHWIKKFNKSPWA